MSGETLLPQAQSWIFGANICGRKDAVMFYMAGLGSYRDAINAVRQGGYRTMVVDRAKEAMRRAGGRLQNPPRRGATAKRGTHALPVRP